MRVLSHFWRRSWLLLPVPMLKAPCLLIPCWLWHFPFPGNLSPSSLPFGLCSQCHQKHRQSFHVGFFEIIHGLSYVAVSSSAHTSPTSPFLLPLSFISLDSFQELCNPSFAISFNNLGKVGFCHTFRLACSTKIAKIPF